MAKFALIVAIVSIAAIVLASAKLTAQCGGVDDFDKIDCGISGTTQEDCEQSGCCWSPAGEGSSTPWCYKPGTAKASYALGDVKKTSTGLTGTLSTSDSSATGINTLKLEFVYETVDTFRVRITDPHGSDDNAGGVWEVPQSVLSRKTPADVAPLDASSLNYEVTYKSSPFQFTVSRKSDGELLFDLNGSITYQEQLLSVSTTIGSGSKTYGLGESTRLNQALENGIYTMWAADIPAAQMNSNLYGSYPFYMQMTESGTSHGALLLNANGMDVALDDTTITFKTLGGIVDLYMFAGETPQQVVSQYQSIVGFPMMPAYWTLGFHNCKYGYTGVEEVEEVVAGYQKAGIPLDTQWMDIDYMSAWEDWTWDAKNFNAKEVSSFVDGLHEGGMHFVPIVDPGIQQKDGYQPYEDGLKADIFVKDITGETPYLGQVWPGPVYFPDFTHPNAQQYWTDSVKGFHDSVKIDGIWIDMNEVSNFCNADGKGQVCTNPNPDKCPTGELSTQTQCCLVCETVDATNKYDFPEYQIHNHQGSLGGKTMAPSVWFHGNVSGYNMHNLYGLTEAAATNAALTEVRGERPFLLTRSSFLSSGKHTAKWTGDNAATWQDLQSSIVSIMDFNLFGMPAIGADICGFIGNTNEELCARWIEVGAFYPFSRNHNTLGADPQELYLWDSVTAAAKTALGIRYQILPYMYSLFYNAHTLGQTVARSLWLNFPKDSKTYTNQEQFMLGAAVMVTPVLAAGETSVDGYFPEGFWYDFQTHELIDASTSGPKTVTLNTPLEHVNVHVYGGNVVPMQSAAMTTTESRKTPFTLLVALCPKGGAYGELFVDDGVQTEGSISKNLFRAEYKVAAGEQALVGSVLDSSYKAAAQMPLGSVVILGVASEPKTVMVNGKSAQFDFNVKVNELTVTVTGVSITDELNVTWK